MAMKKILIIGGGFAGLSAANTFYKSKLDLEVILIDKKKEFNFLPLLPDIIGRRINSQLLTANLEDLGKKLKFNFVNREVTSVNLENKLVCSKEGEFNYDYLIIAAGSLTNFYGNSQIERYAFKLDGVNDMQQILKALDDQDFDDYIVCGGGYTGIEIATNLNFYCKRKVKDKKIVIVERAPHLLGLLPGWMKVYVKDNLRRINIETFVNCSVEKIEDRSIFLSNGKIYHNSLLIWTAGVKTPDFLQQLNQEKTPQGRIRVDDYLRLNNSCFVIGDCAYFPYRNNYLRMAVQFSITQGELAAKNIMSSILNRPLRKYKPRDLGYIIPMANNRSCGKVLGINVRGIFATALHYLMCIYRTLGLKNKIGIAKNLISR